MSENIKNDSSPDNTKQKLTQTLGKQSQGAFLQQTHDLNRIRKVSQSLSQLHQEPVQFDEEKLQRLSKAKLIELFITQNIEMNKLFKIQQEKIQQLQNTNKEQEIKIKKCQHQIKKLKDNQNDQLPDMENFLERNFQNSVFNSEISINSNTKQQGFFKKRFSENNNKQLSENLDKLKNFDNQLKSEELRKIYNKLVEKVQQENLDKDFWKHLKTYSSRESDLHELESQIIQPIMQNIDQKNQKHLLNFYKNLLQQQKLNHFLDLQFKKQENQQKVEEFFIQVSKQKNLDILEIYAEIFEDVSQFLNKDSVQDIKSECNKCIDELKQDLKNVDRKKLSLVMQSFKKNHQNNSNQLYCFKQHFQLFFYYLNINLSQLNLKFCVQKQKLYNLSMGICRSKEKKQSNYSMTHIGKLQDSHSTNYDTNSTQQNKEIQGDEKKYDQNYLIPFPKKVLTFEETLSKFFDKNYRFRDRGNKSKQKIQEYHMIYPQRNTKEYFTEQQQQQILQSILFLKETPRWTQHDFKKISPTNLQQIGKGSFGTVFKAYDNANKIDIVIKRILIKKLDNKERQNLYKEIELLQVLKNVNIVEFYGHSLKEEYLDIYQEYVDLGSIQNYIQKFQTFPEPLVAFFSCQILQGLKYLHGKNLLHRDIKPANLVFNKKGILKLIDFGLTKHLNSKDESSAGTPAFMSPEMYKNQKSGRFSDIWSFGCTVLQMLTGKLLCNNKQQLKEEFRTKKEDYWFLKNNEISVLAKDFIFCCLRKDSYKRKNVIELLEHPFLQLQYFLKQSEMWTSVYTYSSIFGLQKMATKKGLEIQKENTEIKFSQLTPTFIQSEIHVNNNQKPIYI